MATEVLCQKRSNYNTLAYLADRLQQHVRSRDDANLKLLLRGKGHLRSLTFKAQTLQTYGIKYDLDVNRTLTALIKYKKCRGLTLYPEKSDRQ